MSKNITIPIAIIFAGFVIAATLYINNTPDNNPNRLTPSSIPLNIRAVDETDHIIGNPLSEIIIVEYVDTNCPACRAFHETMKAIIEKYGDLGQVAWVHRHLPISSNSKIESEALECAAEIGGKSKFWSYLENLYINKDRGPIESKDLPNIAEEIDLNKDDFNKCIRNGKYIKKIETDIEEALRLGALGTPFTIIISTKNNTHKSFTGTVQFEDLDKEISLMLSI